MIIERCPEFCPLIEPRLRRQLLGELERLREAREEAGMRPVESILDPPPGKEVNAQTTSFSMKSSKTPKHTRHEPI